jgi:hypothetical protein
MRRAVGIGGLLSFLLAGSVLAGFVPAALAMDNYPTARLRMLDKVTARTSTFDVRIDTTVRFGPLYIRPRACRKSSPLEAPESAAFLQIWEVTPRQDAQWIFSGWMFSSSPALSSMDNPIYDVWVLDCMGDALGGAGQIGFSSGQINFASGGVHTQVSFMSGGQISYASGQIHFASGGGQIGLSSSSGLSPAVNDTSSGIQAEPLPPPPAPPSAPPAPSPEDEAMPAPGNSGAYAPPQQRQPSPDEEETAPSSIQEPVY